MGRRLADDDLWKERVFFGIGPTKGKRHIVTSLLV